MNRQATLIALAAASLSCAAFAGPALDEAASPGEGKKSRQGRRAKAVKRADSEHTKPKKQSASLKALLRKGRGR